MPIQRGVEDMDMKRIYLVTVIFLLLGSANFVAANPPLHRPGNLVNIWEIEDQHLSRLDLTDEQREKIKQIRNKVRKDMVPLKLQRYEMFAERRLIWMDPDFDTEEIRNKAKKFHEIMWRLISLEMDYRIEFRGVLTREQYVQFIELGGFR